MILPIGHQEREVRRLPWVSFALMAICALVFLFTDTNAPQGPTDDETRKRLRALGYVVE